MTSMDSNRYPKWLSSQNVANDPDQRARRADAHSTERPNMLLFMDQAGFMGSNRLSCSG
jgi:hypothetical protein